LGEFCSAFASTQPTTPPATRSWERAADRLLAATRPELVPLLLCLGLAASILSRVLPAPFGLLALAAFFLVAGGWCTLNLVRCREAHCLVTGVGWDVLGVVALGAIVVGADVLGWVWLVFFTVLVVGVIFELGWARVRGGTALRRNAR
jgi:hypothetical protein